MLLAVDGYTYNGKDYPRTGVVAEIAGSCPRSRPWSWSACSAPRTRTRPDPGGSPAARLGRAWATARQGTEGRARVRGGAVRAPAVGVCTLAARRACPSRSCTATAASCSSTSRRSRLHQDLRPGDRFFWYTTTGWMMWNFLVSGLLAGTTIVVLRRQRRATRPRPAVAAGRRGAAQLPGRRRAVPAGLPEGGAASRTTTTTSRSCGASARPARRCRPRPSAGSTTRSARRAARLAVRRHRRVHRVRRVVPVAAGPLRRDLRPQPRAPTCRPSTSTGTPSSARSASSCSPRRCRRCPCGSGTTPTASGTGTATSRSSPACGGTATGSRSCPTAAASSTAAPTRRSTGAACGWAPASSTASSSRCPRSPTAWWWTPAGSAPKAGWCCSSSCAPGHELDDDLTSRVEGRAQAAAVTPARPRRDGHGARRAADPVGQEAGDPGAKDFAGHTGRTSRRSERAGQPGSARGIRAANYPVSREGSRTRPSAPAID